MAFQNAGVGLNYILMLLTADSQAAIPLSMKSSSRALVLYELMDSAYDVNAIKDYISEQGRLPLVKPHKKKRKEKRRY